MQRGRRRLRCQTEGHCELLSERIREDVWSSRKQRKAAEKDKGVLPTPIPFEEAPVGDLLKVKPGTDKSLRREPRKGKEEALQWELQIFIHINQNRSQERPSPPSPRFNCYDKQDAVS